MIRERVGILETTIRTHLDLLASSSIVNVGQDARVVIEQLNAGTFQLGPKAPFQLFTMPTHFDIIQKTSSPADLPTGVIAFDSQIVHGNARVIQSDLVRTVSLGAQYASGQYDRRMRTVMQDAIDTQREWLETNNFDPRAIHDEELLKVLLGPAYYTDFGIEDWKKSGELYISSMATDQQKGALEELLNDNLLFRYFRAAGTGLIHNEAMAQISNYEQLSPQKRAEMASNALIRGVLKIKYGIMLPGINA